MRYLSRRHLIGVAAGLCTSFGTAWADNFPSKPIRLITPNSAGSGADGMTRRLADYLSRSLKQAFVVDNLPGAGGMLGSETLIRSAADGYTIGLISSNYVVFPHVYKRVSFDALKDITPIAGVASTPMVLVARADLPAANVADLKAMALKEPGKYTLGSSGNGTVLHLAGMHMQEMGRFSLLHIPYKGVAPIIPDLVSGVVDVAFLSYAAVEGLVKQGRLKVLAVSSAQRITSLPDIPTVAETIPGCVLNAWYAVIGPKGMPGELVRKLNDAISAVLRMDAFQNQIAAEGATVMPMSPDALKSFLASEYAKHGALVARSGAVIE
ncbi:MAG: tripartite tricarboxylate transporter substrate binding protein [Curvibacter lanceolatus]|jgi:tripartite-type tricarboxylate transporter receptor subunit TctC|uniref:Bug family tripartite tricarboxylate transporter substrate binding protein n=1 Tax=Curvibacter lanceolatus TaxID=86182 RepID=UPI002352D41D|nr:tripartite tricarboxylate transporter substrate binding protein [Curvibacter lanceolatus]MBV5291434.1 tripartite tricarboxylate transporter substrate binding protein [Curvibacter lanceolatus]